MQGLQPDPDLEQVYMIMGNPYMRAILRTVGEKGEVSFSELKSAVGTSTGNLYYNLDKLKGFITKNDRRKYVLTDKGVKLYKFIQENEVRIRSLMSERGGFHAVFEKYIAPILVPESLASFLYSEVKPSFVMMFVYLFSVILASVHGSFICFGLDQLFPPPTLGVRVALTLAGLVILILALEAPSRLMGGERRIGVDYIATLLTSTLPLSFLALVPLDVFHLNLLFRVIQVVVICLLTATLKVYKRLPAERAFISVFTAYYASYNLALIIQRFF
ncbi:hypothetical protein IG193_03715 [Infirmifilum lucidum]|uniref:DUF7347 domain-containing protein n=1 Tax=Infirmifilum lucidum TaxID=2776706 RepID=A0A7L9FL62_9CREN|nr:hypothetical protein [Infirmifilum lucidum]QOJ79575.1 hypothetical protein IG193_03715 [Infirmifilum lucidum]